MNWNQFFFVPIIFITTIIQASTQTLTVTVTPLKHQEKVAFFSCLNPIKARHLATRYTLINLRITNNSTTDYYLNPKNSGLNLIKPSRLAERVEINRTWLPITVGITAATLLSSIFYIAYVPCIAISFLLGATTATISPHKMSRKNKERMRTTILDDEHETLIPACNTIKKTIALRAKKHRGKIGTLQCTNRIGDETVTIKIPCP